MDNQKLFMEMLNDLMDYARANNNSISTGDIDDVFSEIELTGHQLEYIYDYMYSGGITVRGYVKVEDYNTPPKSDTEAAEDAKDAKDAEGVDRKRKIESDKKEQKKNAGTGGVYGREDSILSKSSNRLKDYRRNVKEIETVDEAGLEEACRRLLSGMADDADKNMIMERHLVTVINIASRYSGKGVSADELIQEGNLALVIGVKELDGLFEEPLGPDKKAAAICEDYLRKQIRSGIVEHIDSVIEQESNLAATIAKAGLINEAVKTLAKEYGRIATITELSQFTHIPVSEIRDIIRISGDSIEVGKE